MDWLAAEQKAAIEAEEAQRRKEEEEMTVTLSLSDETAFYVALTHFRWVLSWHIQHVQVTQTTVMPCCLERAIGRSCIPLSCTP